MFLFNKFKSQTSNYSEKEKDKSWGNPMIRTRSGAGTITASCDKISIDFGIMSFYENGPEYDMNKVIRRKNIPISSYSLPIPIEGGYNIADVIFKFPEDFLIEDQVSKQDTIAYRNKKEIEEKERLRHEIGRAHV